MDLNYLFHRHQVSLMMAAAATGREAHRAHRGLAQRYAASIAAAQERIQVTHPFVAA